MINHFVGDILVEDSNLNKKYILILEMLPDYPNHCKAMWIYHSEFNDFAGRVVDGVYFKGMKKI